jgi:hypothetical protein
VTVTQILSNAQGRIDSQSATYATARDGGGTKTVSADPLIAGQLVFGDYIVRQTFIQFDTSSIPSTDIITNVTLELYAEVDSTTTDFECRVSTYDWGGTVDIGDFRTGAQLLALETTGAQLRASRTEGAGGVNNYHAFTSAGAGLINSPNLGTGTVRYVVYSFKQRGTGTAPTNNEFMEYDGGANLPRLTITHQGPSITPTGGVIVGGTADVVFGAGSETQVDADVEVLWDFDGDGDFSEPVENITGYVMSVETAAGRDWPSQVNGRAGPGKLRMTLDNTDDRFSYFNTSSPLVTAPFSLDVGRKIRVQATGTPNPDPTLLARDRFNRPDQSGLGDAETGQTWTQPLIPQTSIVDNAAKANGTGGTFHMCLVDVGVADYYAQVTIVEPGENCTTTAQQTRGNAGLVFRYQDTSNYSIFRVVRPDDSQMLELQVVNVVAGTPTTISSGQSVPGRKEITLGVRVLGSAYTALLEGVGVYSGTAIQTDETEVGFRGEFGIGNVAPIFDDFYVWSRMPEAQEGVLFTGKISDVSQSVTLGPLKLVTVNAEGVLADLAARNVKPQGVYLPGVWTGYSAGEALIKAGAIPPPRNTSIDGTGYGWSVGTRQMGAYGYDSSGITALEHCRKVEAVEFGFLHEAPEGWPVLHRRTERDTAAPMALFSDDPNDQFGYSSIEPLDWRKEIINEVTVGVSAYAPSLIIGSSMGGSTAAGVRLTINPTMPATQAGDLLIAFFVSTIRSDTENWRVPIFWQRLRDTGGGGGGGPRMQVYAHPCDGTEGGTQPNFYNDTANAGGSYVGLLWVVRNWYGNIDEGVKLGDPARGNSQAGANPAAILPQWGVTNATLFLAQRTGGNVAGSGAGSVTNPTYPLGYILTSSTFQNGNTNDFDCAEQHGIKSAITTIEDPGSFGGFSGIGNAETNVVAVRAFNGSPPEQNGRYLLTFEDTDSQDRIGAVRTHEGPTLFANESDATSYANAVLDTFANDRPIVRVTFPATISAAYRDQAIRRRLGQKIRLKANGTTGNTTGLGIDGEFFIENIAHKLSNAGKVWTVTWELSPA